MGSNPGVWSVSLISGLYQQWVQNSEVFLATLAGSLMGAVVRAAAALVPAGVRIMSPVNYSRQRICPGAICQHCYRLLNASNASILSGWGLAVRSPLTVRTRVLSLLLKWWPWLYFMCEKNTRVVVQACCGVCSADLNTYGTVHCWLKMLIGKLSEFLEIWWSQKTKSFNSSALLKNNSSLTNGAPPPLCFKPLGLKCWWNGGGGYPLQRSPAVAWQPHPRARTHLQEAYRAQWTSAFTIQTSTYERG